MSYDPRALSQLSFSEGFSFWAYVVPKGDDPLGDDYYFDDAANLLRPGDLIVLNYKGLRKTEIVSVNCGHKPGDVA